MGLVEILFSESGWSIAYKSPKEFIPQPVISRSPIALSVIGNSVPRRHHRKRLASELGWSVEGWYLEAAPFRTTAVPF